MQPVLRQQGPVAIINHSNYKIMQKNRHCHRVGRYRWHKFGRIMKLCLIGKRVVKDSVRQDSRTDPVEFYGKPGTGETVGIGFGERAG